MPRWLLPTLLIVSTVAGVYLLVLLSIGDRSWVTYANAAPIAATGAVLIAVSVLVAGWVTVKNEEKSQ